MRIAAMRDQSEKALISPLALEKVNLGWLPRFRRAFEKDLIRALIHAEARVGEKDQARPEEFLPTFSLVVAAGLNYAVATTHFRDGTVIKNMPDRWFALTGSHVSFWVCGALHDGDAMYWYRSHRRIALLRYTDLYDRFQVEGYEGLHEMIASEVFYSLFENSVELMEFERFVRENGTDCRVT